MNCASAGGAPGMARSRKRVRRRPRRRRGRRRVIILDSLFEKDAGPADLLGRDHPEEVRQKTVHELEVGGERRYLLFLSVEDFLGELLLLQGLPGASVQEVEIPVQAEALALGIAVAAHHLGASPRLP